MRSALHTGLYERRRPRGPGPRRDLRTYLGHEGGAAGDRTRARRGGAGRAGRAGRPSDVAARPDGLLVLAALSPERVLVADPRTGRTRQRELAGGTLCHGPLLVAGDRVVFFGLRDGLVARAAPLDRLRDDRVIGSAATAIASATPGRLWLGDRRGERLDLREVDETGRVHARASVAVERWGALAAHVGGEFLTTRGAGLAFGRERIRDGWLLAADAERFAWCGGDCERVQLWSGDDRRTLQPPRGIRPQPGPHAALSPDGRRLAISVTVAGKPRFAVVDLERDEWSIVPGARPGVYAALAWSPSGSWLYVATRDERLLASRARDRPPDRAADRSRRHRDVDRDRPARSDQTAGSKRMSCGSFGAIRSSSRSPSAAIASSVAGGSSGVRREAVDGQRRALHVPVRAEEAVDQQRADPAAGRPRQARAEADLACASGRRARAGRCRTRAGSAAAPAVSGSGQRRARHVEQLAAALVGERHELRPQPLEHRAQPGEARPRADVGRGRRPERGEVAQHDRVDRRLRRRARRRASPP